MCKLFGEYYWFAQNVFHFHFNSCHLIHENMWLLTSFIWANWACYCYQNIVFSRAKVVTNLFYDVSWSLPLWPVLCISVWLIWSYSVSHFVESKITLLLRYPTAENPEKGNEFILRGKRLKIDINSNFLAIRIDACRNSWRERF